MNRDFITITLPIMVFFVLAMSGSLSMTATSTSTPCFQCRTVSTCIALILKCDGINDCPDFSDERNCSCGPESFVCNNGRCIAKSWLCDGDDDCYDKSDEMNCTIPDFCKNNGNCDHSCQVTGNKNGTPTGRTCSCRAGYYLRSDGRSCVDIDECTKKGICGGRCINTVGSYKCVCGSGFTKGTVKNTCKDINECDTNNGGCEHLCHNTYGNYYCSCKKGYVRSDMNPKHCNDIDECAFGVANCHYCLNVPGRFRCKCDAGYVQNANKTACQDINECSRNNGGCEHICQNIPGKYKCRCKPGFEAVPAGSQFCRDINECKQNNGKGPCDHKCKNENGKHSCSCNKGYILSKDGHSCEDIDECRTKGRCDHICVNTRGGYYCDCRNGFYLAQDGKKCDDTKDFSECGVMKTMIKETRRWTDTNKDEWPWIVRFTSILESWFRQETNKWGVLGIILSDKWVLTASHSLPKGGSYRVHTNNGGTADVAEVIPYSSCKPKIAHCKNDIALAKLARPIKFAENVRPICIPGRTKQQSFLQNRSEPAMILSNLGFNGLQKRTVRVRRSASCTHYSFSNHMICAGGERGSCAGDSGSPLMFSRREYNRINQVNRELKNIAYLSGVLSWGNDILHGADRFDFDFDECNSDPQFLAYTNIVRYLKWIQDETGIVPRQ